MKQQKASVIAGILATYGCLFLQAQQRAQAEVIHVPAGTRIQLELVTALDTRGAHSGDRVRAEVAFPVTVGSAVAIPAGTFVTGVINKITAHSPAAKFHMTFDAMIFASGYTLSGGDGKASAQLQWPSAAMGFQSFPTPPALPNPPSINKGLIFGPAVAIGVAMVIGIALAHHRGTVFTLESGSKFEMVLQQELLVDTGAVTG